MKRQLDLPRILLATVAFFIPLWGGQFMLEAGTAPSLPSAVAQSLLGSSDTPIFAHAFLALILAVAFVYVLLTRRVVQVPNITLGVIAMIFAGVAIASTVASDYKTASLPIALEWATYALAIFATVSAAGRRDGPIAITAALVAGCSILAGYGLRDYGQMRQIDPTWRLFVLWQNPNAFGTMLLPGFVLALSFLFTQKAAKALLAALAAVFTAFAIALSQSKGATALLLLVMAGCGFCLALSTAQGLLARGSQQSERSASRLAIKTVLSVALGAIVYFVVKTFLPQFADHKPILLALTLLGAGASAACGRLMTLRQQPHIQLGRLAGVSVFVALLGFLTVLTAGNSSSSSSFSHLTDVASATEQSSGFRTLMWKTASQLFLHNPFGSGIGTFRYESGKPGLATQTVLAHSTYFQLLSEAVPLLVLLIAVLAVWLWLVFRGFRTLPDQSRALLGAIVTSVLAISVHGVIDSDLYYYGLGLGMFMLMGVGLLLSADAVAPEFLFPIVKRCGGVASFILVTGLLYFGYTEALRAQVRGSSQARDFNGAQATLSTLHSVAPTDGEAWYLTAMATPDTSEQLAAATKAVEYAPTTRNLRLLARVQLSKGDIPHAVTSVNRALALDPNSLSSLSLLAQMKKQTGLAEDFVSALRRIIAVEKTSYFTVRSLPELVPTETYEARVELADLVPDSAAKRRLLKEAVAGFKEYLRLTVPNVIRMAKLDPPTNYGGDDLTKAKAKLDTAAQAAQRLADLDRRAGDTAGATAAEADAAGFLGGIK